MTRNRTKVWDLNYVTVIMSATTKVSMTQDKYMSRGRVHTQVTELLDRTINDE